MSIHLGQHRSRSFYSPQQCQGSCYDPKYCQGNCFDPKPCQDEKKWSALYDDREKHPMCPVEDEGITQEATQTNKEVQVSEDFMLIKDSCDVNVTTTDVQAAVNLQAALQAAIVLVVRISLAGSDDAEDVTQELMQTSKIKQRTSQKTIIENSRDVNVTSTDVQVALNIQLLLQILIALVVTLDIL
ncbi:spore coat protein [Salicibibacter kimchii]|uniref:Spore coat protein n=1 Tax=Salicibibacter kimchii TaxID=2099786 RepID=A0A345BUZ5_9BACI|nr:spore coat protein [Salicibibacter kimchii]AXF54776.1 spore coat protein [Salicibibacter kimchii]